MKTINTLDELRMERRRLKLQAGVLEDEIKSNIASIRLDIRETLNPLKKIKEGAGNFLMNEQHGVLPGVMGSLINVLTKKVLFRNAGFVTRMIVPLLLKNFTSNLVGKNQGKLVGWFLNLFPDSKHHKSNGTLYDKGTVYSSDY